MAYRRQAFARPASDMPNSAAGLIIGVDNTLSYRSLRFIFHPSAQEEQFKAVQTGYCEPEFIA